MAAVGLGIAFSETGSPWKSGHCESFNSKLWDEPLDEEIFLSLAEAWIITDGLAPAPRRGADALCT
ncbi:integrase core domain-containing protein [Azorhizobium caulinodans]|uniref:integrase core domain-containing protein n=1 Tax=Azorhizobium caulinodans TaxID=7 RepID=UPI0009D69021